MSTDEKRASAYLRVGGLVLAQRPQDLVDSLFHLSGTAKGFWSRHEGGVLVSDLQERPRVFIATDRDGAGHFFVSCHAMPDGRVRYMHGTSEADMRWLGIDALGYQARLDEAERVMAEVRERAARPPKAALSVRDVQDVLREAGERVDAAAICFYPSIEALAERCAASRHWQIGETFVYAPSSERWVIATQVAPDSCEMMVLGPGAKPWRDVYSAYKMGAAEFADALRRDCEPRETPAPQPVPGCAP